MVIIAFSGSFFNSCCVFGCSVLAHRRTKIAFHAEQAVGMWSCKLTWVGSPGVNRWFVLHCGCTQHPTPAEAEDSGHSLLHINTNYELQATNL